MSDSFKPTEQMAANARRALEVRANKPASQQGMTSVGLARARQLIRRQALSLSTVKRMASFFARHEVDKSGATWADKGKGWQAWMGWGGDAGRAWANAIVKSAARPNPRRGVPLSIGMCMPEIVAAAQRVYDDWDEDDEDLGGGGICDLIADEIVGVLSAAGFEAQTVLQSHGAQHVFTIAKVPEGVYTIDISPFVYEEGSMFSWEKIPDVVFDEDAVEVMQLSADPSKFDDYCY